MVETPSINGDLTRRVVVDTAAMDWTESPGGEVLRKRLHLVGPAEAGQVTAVVRYAPGSTFPSHGHPDGEELLVLDGTFSDEHGDWPSGTYQLNPEGFRHAPFSREGCLIFVKLRQYAGTERAHACVDTNALEWVSAERGVERRLLYRVSGDPEEMRLERWSAGARLERAYPGGVELFVIEGALADGQGLYTAGTWLRLPPGAAHVAESGEGCTLYAKLGGVAGLRAG